MWTPAPEESTDPFVARAFDGWVACVPLPGGHGPRAWALEPRLLCVRGEWSEGRCRPRETLLGARHPPKRQITQQSPPNSAFVGLNEFLVTRKTWGKARAGPLTSSRVRAAAGGEVGGETRWAATPRCCSGRRVPAGRTPLASPGPRNL